KRRLYLPAGFPSMFLYCVHELHLWEDAAYKRTQAARTAWQFPAVFDAVAEGRLHLRGVNLLAPYLTPENADALLQAAANKTTREIEQLLAERFPRSETLALVHAIPSSPSLSHDHRPLEPVESYASDALQAPSTVAARQVAIAARPNVTPIAPERFFIPLTVGRETPDDRQYTQAL